MRSGLRRRVLLALALSTVAAGASAQADCDKLQRGLQPRCELVNRMREACAGGGTAEQVRKCEKQHLQLSTREDCTTVPAAARAMCEQHNRAVAKIERCKNLTGTELDACLRSNASRPGFRQL